MTPPLTRSRGKSAITRRLLLLDIPTAIIWNELCHSVTPGGRAVWVYAAIGFLIAHSAELLRAGVRTTRLLPAVLAAVTILLCYQTYSAVAFLSACLIITPRTEHAEARESVAKALLAVTLAQIALDFAGGTAWLAECFRPFGDRIQTQNCGLFIGPTYSMFPAGLAAAAIILSRVRAKTNLLARISGTALPLLAYLAAQSVIRSKLPPNSADIATVEAQLKYASWLVLSVACVSNYLIDVSITGSVPAGYRLRHSGTVLAALGIALIISHPIAQFVKSRASHISPLRLAVLNEGGFDWERPRHGSYGDFSSGMFGLLPVYARCCGAQVEAIDRSQLASLSDHADALMIINLRAALDENLTRSLENYMNDGGSVIVLGDHTNVFGLMEALNPMLDRFGVAFRFDSAYPSNGKWVSRTWSPIDSPSSWDGFIGQDLHAIGASLSIKNPNRPLLVGTAGFSDRGSPGNTKGAFLGNYTLDRQESVGDLVLASWRTVGRGRLIVYGDTSAFQNGALASTWFNQVMPLLDSCSEPSAWLDGGAVRVTVLLIALCAAVIALAFNSLASGHAIAILAATLIAVPAHRLALRATATQSEVRASEMAIVDHSLLPRTGHYEIGMNDVGPLYVALQRAGLVAVKSDANQWWRRGTPRCVAVIAPTVPASDEWTANAISYVERGGTMLIACGPAEAVKLDALLAYAGIEVTRKSLGSYGSLLDETVYQGPRFRDAWELSCRPTVATLFEYDGVPVAAMSKTGNGAIVVIGDPKFFSSRNIERSGSFHRGTVAFVYRMLEAALQVDHDKVEPIFTSPIGGGE